MVQGSSVAVKSACTSKSLFTQSLLREDFQSSQGNREILGSRWTFELPFSGPIALEEPPEKVDIMAVLYVRFDNVVASVSLRSLVEEFKTEGSESGEFWSSFHSHIVGKEGRESKRSFQISLSYSELTFRPHLGLLGFHRPQHRPKRFGKYPYPIS